MPHAARHPLYLAFAIAPPERAAAATGTVLPLHRPPQPSATGPITQSPKAAVTPPRPYDYGLGRLFPPDRYAAAAAPHCPPEPGAPLPQQGLVSPVLHPPGMRPVGPRADTGRPSTTKSRQQAASLAAPEPSLPQSYSPQEKDCTAPRYTQRCSPSVNNNSTVRALLRHMHDLGMAITLLTLCEN